MLIRLPEIESDDFAGDFRVFPLTSSLYDVQSLFSGGVPSLVLKLAQP